MFTAAQMGNGHQKVKRDGLPVGLRNACSREAAHLDKLAERFKAAPLDAGTKELRKREVARNGRR